MGRNKMSAKEQGSKSCLISAPLGAELGLLPTVLERAGVDWQWARTDLGANERLPGDLRRIVRGVDFVVGVIFGRPEDSNTFFELGIAVGIGKPMLLVIASGASLPVSLESAPYLRASLQDEKALALHLDLLFRTMRQANAYPTSGRARGSKIVAQELPVLEGKKLYSRPPESAFEAQVAQSIETAGGRVVLHPRLESTSNRYTPDLLFWLPERDAEILNPAVVELRDRPDKDSRLVELQMKLLTFMSDTRVRTGLIITRETPASTELRSGPTGNVFLLGFDRFRQLLQHEELAKFLRLERNRAAHGIR